MQPVENRYPRMERRLLAPVVGAVLLAAVTAGWSGVRQRPEPGSVAPAAHPDSARVTVETALHALGGSDFLAGRPGLHLRIAGIRRWEGQGPSPVHPVDTHAFSIDEVYLAGAGVAQRYVQEAGGEVDWCVEVRATAAEGYQYDCLSRVLRPFPSGAASQTVAQVRQRQVHGQVAALLAPPVTVTWIRTFDSAGQRLRELRESPPRGPERTWLFDVATGLPMSVAWGMTTALGDSASALTRFEDYRQAGPVRLPFLVRTHRPGDASDDRRLVDVETVSALPAARRPGEAGVVAGPALGGSNPSVTSLDSGAILIEDVVPGYNSMVVDLGDGLAVFDAPGDEGSSRAALQLISHRFPDQTIRYVVPTHFHYDHLAGVAEYVRRGATVLTTEGNVRWMREWVTRRAGGALTGRRTPIVQAVRDGQILGRGRGRVELRVVDARPHVEEMILGYLTGSRTLFVTDLFFLEPAGGVRPASLERVRFDATLRRLRRPVERLVGGHGGVATVADLRTSLGLRPAGGPVPDPPLRVDP